MSAIEPCLKPKEMPTSGAEFLDAFKTIDEDKDSDDESFHLFLEGDDDFNKSDEKLQCSDANKNNEEEKEEVNELTNESEENCPTKEEVALGLPPLELQNIEKNENNETRQISSNETENSDNCKSAENSKENQLIEDNPAIGTSSDNTKNSENTETTIENCINSCLENKVVGQATNSKTEATLVETEDEILNKLETEDVDEVDPSLEDSLLNEKDDINDSLEKTVIEVEKSVCAPDDENAMIIDNEENSEHLDTNQKMNCENEKSSESNTLPAPDKCNENSNSASDNDDLLDISMIKDSAQDDADIENDALALEAENEDSDGTSIGNSKSVERLESVDDSSTVDNSDEDGKEDYCSGKENAEIESPLIDSSESAKDLDVQESTSTNTIENTNCDVVQSDEIKENSVEVDVSKPMDESDDPSNSDNTSESSTKKRLLSDDSLESDTKKRKLDQKIKENDAETWDYSELKTLTTFAKYMTNTKLRHLKREHLEEFCIQKVCEAIMHKSELGETNHQLRLQEQTIETLRKEQTILAKQIKDLETVNRKLMHEMRTHTGAKPLTPVKITRSVGLQVRISQNSEPNAIKRRSSSGSAQKVQTPVHIVANRSPRNAQNNANKIIQLSPQKPNNTSVLSQVLQNRNRQPAKTTQQNNSPVRAAAKTKQTPEKRQRPSGSFIDLTDEDDKKSGLKKQNSIKALVPQGVRINAIPKTTIPSVLPVSPNTTQLMYVVQSNSQIKQGLLTTTAGGQQKAVLVNFQPQNGVIGSLNTSSVSVIPKPTPNVQLKTSPIIKVHKHPAPLPNPPVTQNSTDKNLKAIPPKPVLTIRKTNTGIILQWRMPYDLGLYEGIASYQLYAYQETTLPPSTDMWRKVGDVKAMALPMACTLTQFADKNKYYFAVRPVDIYKRIGKFSNPEAISL